MANREWQWTGSIGQALFAIRPERVGSALRL